MMTRTASGRVIPRMLTRCGRLPHLQMSSPPSLKAMSAPASPLAGSPPAKPRARSAAFAARIKELEALTKGGGNQNTEAEDQSVRCHAPRPPLHRARSQHRCACVGHPTGSARSAAASGDRRQLRRFPAIAQLLRRTTPYDAHLP
jgi:hypothetical protein